MPGHRRPGEAQVRVAQFAIMDLLHPPTLLVAALDWKLQGAGALCTFMTGRKEDWVPACASCPSGAGREVPGGQGRQERPVGVGEKAEDPPSSSANLCRQRRGPDP